MSRPKTVPIHESLQIGSLLAIVGGFLDAYTYLLKGSVFANAQTGNMVLLGIKLAERSYRSALYYVIPIVAFALGVIVTEYIKRRERGPAYLKWQHSVLIMEILALFVLGWLPAATPDAVVNVSISFVCSLQVCSFRTLVNTPYATTMCTGNLRSAVEHLYRYFANHDKGAGRSALRYLFVIFCFCAGAAVGALLAGWLGDRSIWFACLLLLCVLLLLLADSAKGKRKE